MSKRQEKWDKFRDNAANYAGWAYQIGNVPYVYKAFSENWQDLSRMIETPSIFDTIAIPLFITSAEISRRNGHKHGAKALAFAFSCAGKALIMKRLAIQGDWKSFYTLGADTVLGAVTGIQSFVKYCQDNKKVANDNIRTSQVNDNKKQINSQFKENSEETTKKPLRTFLKNYPNSLPLAGMFAIKVITITAMIIDKNPIYAGMNAIWACGSALMGVSRQEDSKNNNKQPVLKVS